MDLAHNPFFVLELDPQCSRVEVEREGQKLLSMLEVGFAEAASYQTPLGERARTAEDVRQAMATLRDPDRRLLAELWANAPTDSILHQQQRANNCQAQSCQADSGGAIEADDQARSGEPDGFPSAMAALRLQ